MRQAAHAQIAAKASDNDERNARRLPQRAPPKAQVRLSQPLARNSPARHRYRPSL